MPIAISNPLSNGKSIAFLVGAARVDHDGVWFITLSMEPEEMIPTHEGRRPGLS